MSCGRWSTSLVDGVVVSLYKIWVKVVQDICGSSRDILLGTAGPVVVDGVEIASGIGVCSFWANLVGLIVWHVRWSMHLVAGVVCKIAAGDCSSHIVCTKEVNSLYPHILVHYSCLTLLNNHD